MSNREQAKKKNHSKKENVYPCMNSGHKMEEDSRRFAPFAELLIGIALLIHLLIVRLSFSQRAVIKYPTNPRAPLGILPTPLHPTGSVLR